MWGSERRRLGMSHDREIHLSIKFLPWNDFGRRSYIEQRRDSHEGCQAGLELGRGGGGGGGGVGGEG